MLLRLVVVVLVLQAPARIRTIGRNRYSFTPTKNIHSTIIEDKDSKIVCNRSVSNRRYHLVAAA
jgi:hypothetical protein